MLNIEIHLEVEVISKEPIIYFKNKKIDIFHKNIQIKDIIEYPKNNKIEIEIKNIEENSSIIKIKKIIINEVEANIFYNTTFEMKANRWVEEKILNLAHQINFNGTFILTIDEIYLDVLKSEYWYVADNNNDYIYNYHFVNNIFKKHYKPRNHNEIIPNSIACLGDSFSWGTGLESNEAWPQILEETISIPCLNLSVPGAGIDLVYNNFKKLIKEFQFKSFIIVLPNLERRLICCKLSDNQFYKVPNVFSPKYFNKWAYSSYKKVIKRRKFIERRIIKDIKNIYSKRVLNKLINLAQQHKNNVFFTSRSAETYQYLKTIKNINLLPEYPPLSLYKERANDGYHPSFKHNKFFVEQIKDIFKSQN